jgi:hypothetical protein
MNGRAATASAPVVVIILLCTNHDPAGATKLGLDSEPANEVGSQRHHDAGTGDTGRDGLLTEQTHRVTRTSWHATSMIRALEVPYDSPGGYAQWDAGPQGKSIAAAQCKGQLAPSLGGVAGRTFQAGRRGRLKRQLAPKSPSEVRP